MVALFADPHPGHDPLFHGRIKGWKPFEIEKEVVAWLKENGLDEHIYTTWKITPICARDGTIVTGWNVEKEFEYTKKKRAWDGQWWTRKMASLSYGCPPYIVSYDLPAAAAADAADAVPKCYSAFTREEIKAMRRAQAVRA